jgi:hypothetical protein
MIASFFKVCRCLLQVILFFKSSKSCCARVINPSVCAPFALFRARGCNAGDQQHSPGWLPSR